MLTKTFHTLLALVTLCFCGNISAQTPEKTKILKAIVFDYSDVVAEIDKAALIQFLSDGFGISSDGVKRALDKRRLFLAEGGSEDEFWSLFAESIKQELPSEFLKYWYEVRLKAIRPVPGTLDIVKALQRKGIKTPLLCNISKEQAVYVKEQSFCECFEPLLFSFEIGAEKPNPKAYEILLSKLCLKPSEILIIDRAKENVASAKLLGLDSIQFTNATLLVMELNKRGIHLSAE